MGQASIQRRDKNDPVGRFCDAVQWSVPVPDNFSVAKRRNPGEMLYNQAPGRES